MKRINFYLFVTMAMLMLSVSSAWAQYVKVTDENGTVSWIEIEGTINGTNIEIYGGRDSENNTYSAIDQNIKGSIDLNEVWARSGGRGTHYQVTSIGDYAFGGCGGLTSIEIPSSVTSIGDYAFGGCSGLTSVEIPSSVMSIGEYAFYYCSGLTSVVIPSSVTNIERGAFYCCSGLTFVDILSNVTNIETNTFFGCSGLTSVDIPSNVTSIGYYAFSYCSSLTSIVIPSSVTSIEECAFEGCCNLSSVEIPSSVTSIGSGVFVYCSGLTSIVVESGNSVYDSRNDCNAIIETASNTLIVGCKNTKIPSSVTSIGEGAFLGCSGLTSIDIPSNVTSIGNEAFSSCSGLTSVVLPSSVTNIERGSFYGCSGLISVTSYITDVFMTGTNAFFGCDNATLYVPKGLVNTYQSTLDWNRIKKIEVIPGIVLAMSCNNKGKVLIDGTTEFTNNMDEVYVYDGANNTFVFTPDENCQLEQVLIDGLDVTLSVKNNQLTTKIRENSKMIVTFSKSSGDMNGDGMVNISDVVALVNLILGQ